jgi:hypothetical protein
MSRSSTDSRYALSAGRNAANASSSSRPSMSRSGTACLLTLDPAPRRLLFLPELPTPVDYG